MRTNFYKILMSLSFYCIVYEEGSLGVVPVCDNKEDSYKYCIYVVGRTRLDLGALRNAFL